MALDASLTIDKYIGSLPLTVQFTGIALLGTPTSWAWDFGDGITSSEQSPSHTYTSVGSHTLKLNVTDGTDTVNLIYERVITVMKIDFDAYPKKGRVPLNVKFTDKSIISTPYELVSREWNFGDGTAFSVLGSPVHTYVDPGAYSVYFTARVRRT